MSGPKCDACGLVNWPDAKSCKRCGGLLPPPDFRPGRAQRPDPVNTPSLGTFNGIGMRVIGWKHSEDGTATATAWFSILYLPIFPTGRYRLISPRAEDTGPGETNPVLRAMLYCRSTTTIYSFLERLPLSGEEILGMYLYAYLWMPLKILAPLLLLRMYKELSHAPSDETIRLLSGVCVLWMCYAAFALVRLMRRSRGLGAPRVRSVSATSSSSEIGA